MSEQKEYSRKVSNGNPRNLLVFMDGTWNDENGKENDGVTTNIHKLFKALEGTEQTEEEFEGIPYVKTHEKQVALYFRGIGNDDDNNMIGSTFFGAFGGSEKRIRENAYCHIVKHYREGDRISIFGFSRGSAAARLLAADLQKGLATEITAKYKKDKNESTGITELVFKDSDGKGTNNQPVAVEFLGIFDTVGAFGIPIDLGFGFQKFNLFKDLQISNNVKKTVHCVSIDESRTPFIPTLCNKSNKVDEVWFAGVHSDIGGGYRKNELSKIPTKYMIEQLNLTLQGGDKVLFDAPALKAITDYDLNSEFFLHHHGDGLAKEPRSIHVIENDKPNKDQPKIHHSVIELMKSKYMFLSITSDSYVKIDSIRYCPKAVNGLMGKYRTID